MQQSYQTRTMEATRTVTVERLGSHNYGGSSYQYTSVPTYSSGASSLSMPLLGLLVVAFLFMTLKNGCDLGGTRSSTGFTSTGASSYSSSSASGSSYYSGDSPSYSAGSSSSSYDRDSYVSHLSESRSTLGYASTYGPSSLDAADTTAYPSADVLPVVSGSVREYQPRVSTYAGIASASPRGPPFRSSNDYRAKLLRDLERTGALQNPEVVAKLRRDPQFATLLGNTQISGPINAKVGALDDPSPYASVEDPFWSHSLSESDRLLRRSRSLYNDMRDYLRSLLPSADRY